MTGFVPVASLDDVAENSNRAFDVGGQSILLCRSRTGVYAVANRCSHAEAALEGGIVKGVHLFCPLHAARFDMRDGSTSGALTHQPRRKFPARADEGMIYIELEDERGKRDGEGKGV